MGSKFLTTKSFHKGQEECLRLSQLQYIYSSVPFLKVCPKNLITPFPLSDRIISSH